MKILFIGPKFGNSYLSFIALKKINKKVDLINTSNSILNNSLFSKVFIHLSSTVFEKYFYNFIIKKIKKKYDLIYVRSGEIIGDKLIKDLKKFSKKIVFFCNDNPFVKRDKKNRTINPLNFMI